MTFTCGTGSRAHEASATFVANLGDSALVQGLAYELAPRVRVNAVAPTVMGTATSFSRAVPQRALEQTKAGSAEAVPLKRLGTREQVASAYLGDGIRRNSRAGWQYFHLVVATTTRSPSRLRLSEPRGTAGASHALCRWRGAAPARCDATSVRTGGLRHRATPG